MSVVTQRYGYSVHYEVMNDKVGQAFADAATEAKLRVAGAPRIAEKEGAPEGELAFDATFEVYPEVKIGDLGAAEVERVSTEVTEAAIDRTLDILRKQRRSFALRPQGEAAVEGDRVTIDFEGKIDGVPFEGGKADGFQFVIGEGQMLEAFESEAARHEGRRVEDLPAAIPADYQGKDVAGKEADFMVTLRSSSRSTCPRSTRRWPRRSASRTAPSRRCAPTSSATSSARSSSASCRATRAR